MKAVTKSFWRNCLLMGGSFSVLMLLFELIYDSPINPIKSIIEVVLNFTFFGFLMSGYFLLIQKYRLKKLGVENPNYYDLGVRQNRKVISGITQEEFLNRLQMNRLIKYRKIKIDGNIINFKTKMTFKSWGEEVKIIVLRMPDGKNQFDIYSKPILITTLFDYGLNFQNVQRIQDIIEKGG